MLSMIPLVKVTSEIFEIRPPSVDSEYFQLHDMAIGVLSRRIGGSKTGLINASFVRRSSER